MFGTFKAWDNQGPRVWPSRQSELGAGLRVLFDANAGTTLWREAPLASRVAMIDLYVLWKYGMFFFFIKIRDTGKFEENGMTMTF